jgi:alanine-synthesizing transaminase
MRQARRAGRGHHRPVHGEPGRADAATRRSRSWSRRWRQAGETTAIRCRAGIYKLRVAICDWYGAASRRLDPDAEAIVTIGSKEGIGHLALAHARPGDVVFCPSPTYPIHAVLRHHRGRRPALRSRSCPAATSSASLQEAVRTTWPKPKLLIINFPHNPTTEVVDLDFFRGIVDFARAHDCLVVHDLAYADLCFDGYVAPSFLQVPGAKEIGVEFFTLTKSYNMPGWRVGFMVGNREIVAALARVKSYLDYGIFQPVQIAATHALNGPQGYVHEICETYRKRRDVLCEGLDRIGWHVPKPRATMFVWAEIPDALKEMGSLEFSKLLLKEAKVAVSPGIGFGEYGDHYVRFALIENEHRTRQAIRGIRRALGGALAPAARASAG